MNTPDSREDERVHIGLGSNLDDRRAYLDRAIAAVDALEHTGVVATSGVYETEARIVEDQPDFLNACATIKTALRPRKLLDELLAIEDRLGRVRTREKGARRIDLDILIWEGLMYERDGLALPHPELGNRAFVLIPLREIAADVLDPATGLSVEQLSRRCEDDGEIVRLGDWNPLDGDPPADDP